MYTENNRHTSLDRANDDFLRRMLGGELTGGERAVMSQTEDALEEPHRLGCTAGDGCTAHDGVLPEIGGRRAGGEERPRCNDGDENDCPKYMRMPALAMVYAPHQCWQNLLDPESALEHGSQFAELILPLEVAGGCMKTGGGKGRC